MKRYEHGLVSGAALSIIAAGALAGDGHGRGDRHFSARLKPTNEVPALSSVASGHFSATVDETNQTISYTLSYEDLEGAVSQAHIHIGQANVNGGVSVFLCGNPPMVPAPTVPQPPACPPSPATVTGVITAAQIIGPNGQGIAPTSDTVNEFAELVRAMRNGITYANVHTAKFPGGEVRGQLRRGRDRHGDDD